MINSFVSTISQLWSPTSRLYNHIIEINQKKFGALDEKDKLQIKALVSDKFKNDPFHLLSEAACSGDEELLLLFEKAGMDLHQKNALGDNILTVACYSGNIEWIKKIMSMGFSLVEKNHAGETPMEVLVKEVNSNKFLAIAKNSDFEIAAALDKEKKTLELLTQLGTIEAEILQRLMKYANGKEIVQFLLERGAPIDTTDSLGRTPLYHACQQSPLDVAYINFLMEKGADPEKVNPLVQRKNGDIDQLEHQLLQRDPEKKLKNEWKNLQTKRQVLAPLTPKEVIAERYKQEIENEGKNKEDRIAAFGDIAKRWKINVPQKKISNVPQNAEKPQQPKQWSLFVDPKHYSSVWEAIRWGGLRAAHGEAAKNQPLGNRIFHTVAYVLQSIPLFGQLLSLIELVAFRIWTWMQKSASEIINIVNDPKTCKRSNDC